MGDTKLCYGCFSPIGDEDKCPHCGYKQQSPYSPSYIAPGTILKEKYMVGKMLGHNGEGATYLAFDTVLSCKVILKEYMPDTLCSRDKETQAISVNSNSTVQYKSLMEEFTELNKKLAKLRNIDHIQQVQDMFHENNTAYVVFEYLEGQNLMQYLKENGGELSWRRVQKLFPPLFTSLSQLHNAGIIHRGISPNTIFVTKKGELKLTDFCIAAVRTNKEELSSELFKGYAAPEQYSPAIWQGTWTDVYGISSVLYRILTGCMPTEALLRNEADDLTPPASLNVDIPDNVSDAIIGGMKMAGEERIQTISELEALTFRQSDDDMEKTTVNIGNIASQNAREAIQKQRSLEAAAEKAPESDNSERAERYDRSDRYDAPPQRERMIRPAPEPEEFEDEYAIIEKVRPIIFVLILVIIVGAIILFFVKQIGVVGKSKNNGIETNIASVTTEAETEPPVTEVPVEESNGFYIQDVVPATLAPVTVAETVSSQTGMTEFTTGGNAEQNIQMINFIGKNYDDVKLSSLVQDLNITVQYTAAEGKQKGEIIDQSIKEGTWISSGVDVILTVVGDGTDAPLTTLESGGTVVTNSNVVKGVVPNIKTPEGVSQKLKDYIALLDAAGIPYKCVPVSNPDAYPSKGYVVSVDPGVGSSVTGIVEVVFTPDGEYSSTFYSSGQ